MHAESITNRTPRLRRLLTAAAVGAVVAATAVVATAPAADAATTTTKVLRSGDMDFSQSRTAGHNVFEAAKLHVYTDDSTSNAKAAGYFSLNLRLASIVDQSEPTLNWLDGSTPAPGNQLVIDADGDGVADGILVGESATYGTDWWLSNSAKQFVKDGAPSHTGGSGSENHGTLAEWNNAFRDTTVLQGGYSLGSGIFGNGYIDKLTYGDTTIGFTNSTTSTAVRHIGDTDLSDTRTAGHNVFKAAELHVYTDDATGLAKAAGYFPVNLPLANVGEPSLAWTPTSESNLACASTQLRVDFNGDGTFDGTLVGEPVYGHDWWTPDSAKLFVKNAAPLHTGGAGSTNHGTIDQWRVAFPKAQVLTGGYSLGSGMKGDGVISAIDIGTVAYTFANTSPTAPTMSPTTTAGHAVKITLASTDADNDNPTYADKEKVTYTNGLPSHGKLSGTVPDLTYTPTTATAGLDSFSYTVDDGISTPTTGTVSITVNKVQSSTTMEVYQNNSTSPARVRVIATIVAPGAHVDTAMVTVRDGTKTVGTARIANGQVNLLLTHLAKGMHTLHVYFPGSRTALPSSTSFLFRVRS